MTRFAKILGRSLLIGGAALALIGTAPGPKPKPENFLIWTPQEQVFGYRNIEKIFPIHVAARGPKIYPLPVAGKSINPTFTFRGAPGSVPDYIKANRVAGLLVIHDGQIVLEKYGLGETAQDRWTSFSVGKSVTSTLLGAAIKDGYIGSVDDAVTKYIPELVGSAYDGVTIAQVLKMRSGVKWNEDYADPNSDVRRLVSSMTRSKGDSLVSLMKGLPREAAPGTKFVYKTGESNLIGLLVIRATHKSLASYLSEKIWAPFGMEKDAAWMTYDGAEVGGCCISMTLRDYGRFGEFFRKGGVVGDRHILPEGWVDAATQTYSSNVFGDMGYGYQWWTHKDGTFEANGIFGQSIYIDPANKLVIVTSSAWPSAEWEEGYQRQSAFRDGVKDALGLPKQ